jgi:ankyrin repeat protein
MLLSYFVENGECTETHRFSNLIDAAYTGKIQTVEYLVSLHPPVEHTTNALEGACFNQQLEIITLLIAAGADVNANNGRLVNEAAKMDHLEVLQLLVNAGADITLITEENIRRYIRSRSKNLIDYLNIKFAEVNRSPIVPK